ncbi:hypothetical protein EV356DRAFT_508535 [Viridothelium virens]|uniref:Uncharacterized protein n=1 Tax=Viridothelium virens TaxID=1048519 RepID=A0A6A6HIJ6_VIRVR|nr:hypothetical protein EV356DRAFT_508535 [Viridothelium virens]
MATQSGRAEEMQGQQESDLSAIGSPLTEAPSTIESGGGQNDAADTGSNAPDTQSGGKSGRGFWSRLRRLGKKQPIQAWVEIEVTSESKHVSEMQGEDKGPFVSCACYAAGASNPNPNQTSTEGSGGLPTTKSAFLTKQPEEASVSALKLNEAFLDQLNKTRAVLQKIAEIQDQLGLSDSPHRLSLTEFANRVANRGQACLDRVRRDARGTRFEPGMGAKIATVEMMDEIDSALTWINNPQREIQQKLGELELESGWRGRPTRGYINEVFQDVEGLRQQVRGTYE